MSLRPPMMSRDRGLTLVEMLVVLAIIGVVSGATLLSVTPKRSHGVGTEARRLAAAISVVADEATVHESRAALVITASSYDFIGAAKARHVLPDGIILADPSGGKSPLALDDTNAIELTLTRGGEQWVVTFDGIRSRAARFAPGR